VLALCLALGLGAGCRATDRTTPPTTLLAQGWNAYRLGDYNVALTRFEDLLDRADLEPEVRLNALYGKAVTLDLRQPVPSQQDEEARGLYERIAREAPEHDLAAWSRLALARMEHLLPVGEEPDLLRVRAAYQQVVDAHPTHRAGQEALIYQQATLVQSLDPAQATQAIARLQAFLREQPESPFVSEAYNLLAQACETLGRYDAQLDARLQEIQHLEVDPSSPAASDFSWRYWQLATTAEFLAGRLDVARLYYQKLIDEYPMDFRKFGARQALERMEQLEQRLRAEAGS
jgi:tetratricopeptide (TPR) repeat protein